MPILVKLRMPFFNWEQTIKLCQNGDRQAQKSLFGELYPYLNGVAKRYIYNQSYSQDILQEAFINIFKSIQQFDETKSAFKTWATKITINCCLKHNKKYSNLEIETFEIKDFDVAISPEILDEINLKDLKKTLEKMPKQYYEVFNLYIIDGFSHKEIALILELKESLSRQKLSRAKKWIKENLKVDDVLLNVILLLLMADSI